MSGEFDVVVIGSGTAAMNVARPCAEAGLAVAVVDERRFGGTCARRGCQPKKFLVEAAAAVARTRALAGKGVRGEVAVDWPALMSAKEEFTAAVPKRTEASLRRAGVTVLHGTARFRAAGRLTVAADETVELEAGTIVVATGARPRPLDLPGAELLATSEEFLALPAPPRRLVCVGGGFVSFELAHVAALCGARVTILHRGERPLRGFDPWLVDRLVEASRELGIEVRTGDAVAAVERCAGGVAAVTEGGHAAVGDLVLHGAGRLPQLDRLDLDRARVGHDEQGVFVDSACRSVTNPRIYAVGDVVADSPRLAPVADHEGEVAAANIIAGRVVRRAELDAVPAVVFTTPPLARVGLDEEMAAAQGRPVEVVRHDTADWPGSLRIGQRHGGTRVLQDPDDGRILGAHVLGRGAGDVITVFALAVRHGLTADDLRGPWRGYPTDASAVRHMVRGREAVEWSD